MMDQGLDLSRPSEVTPEEIEAFTRAYEEGKGYLLPAFEFWFGVRPELVKQHRLHVVTTRSAGAEGRAAPILAFLHYYAVTGGYEAGVAYEVQLAEHRGASRQDVLDVLAFAFIHAGPRGMKDVAAAMRQVKPLGADNAERNAAAFPGHWHHDPDFFATGIDLEALELQPGEADLVREWYRSRTGEVPEHVEFLARHRPGLLKSWRRRYETAISGTLPVQMIPFLMLHLNATRGFGDGVRDAALLGRAAGLTPDEIIEAVLWGMVYGGPDAITIASKALATVDLG